MARQSSKRPDADEPDTELDETTDTKLDDDAAADPGAADAEAANADAAADAAAETVDADAEEGGGDDGPEADEPADRTLWDEVRIDPVEIALPSGTGYTLRAYRMSNEVTPTDVSDRDEDDPFAARARDARAEEEEIVILDEQFADVEEEKAEKERPRAGRKARAADDDEEQDGEPEGEEPDAEADVADDESTEVEEEEEPEEEEPAAEEVPAFLTHRGKLLLFKSPEALVSFVKSGAPHDMAELDTWDDLVARLQPSDIAPLDEDSYELDLVVENLRGGHDAWDPTLLIEAGEVARDLAYAMRLTSVLDMLSSGSSLDDLDEALRSAVKGGLGGFMGRRRLKKIGAQTASLGWRTIVGKISAAVDWRD